MLRELPLPITDRDEGTRLMSSPKKVVSMELIVRIKLGLDRSLADELLKTRDTRCLVGDSCLLPAAVVVAVAGAVTPIGSSDISLLYIFVNLKFCLHFDSMRLQRHSRSKSRSVRGPALCCDHQCSDVMRGLQSEKRPRRYVEITRNCWRLSSRGCCCWKFIGGI